MYLETKKTHLIIRRDHSNVSSSRKQR